MVIARKDEFCQVNGEPVDAATTLACDLDCEKMGMTDCMIAAWLTGQACVHSNMRCALHTKHGLQAWCTCV